MSTLSIFHAVSLCICVRVYVCVCISICMQYRCFAQIPYARYGRRRRHHHQRLWNVVYSISVSKYIFTRVTCPRKANKKMTSKKSSCDRCENWMEKAFRMIVYRVCCTQCAAQTRKKRKQKPKTQQPISNFRMKRMCSCYSVKLINYSRIIDSIACGQKVFKPKTNVILDVNIQIRIWYAQSVR